MLKECSKTVQKNIDSYFHEFKEDSSKLIRVRLNGKGDEQWCEIIGRTRLLPNHIYCWLLNHQVVRLFQESVNGCLKLCHSCRAKGKSSCRFTKCSGRLEFQALKAHIHKCHLSTSSRQYIQQRFKRTENIVFPKAPSLTPTSKPLPGGIQPPRHARFRGTWSLSGSLKKERWKGQAFFEARIRSPPNGTVLSQKPPSLPVKP